MNNNLAVVNKNIDLLKRLSITLLMLTITRIIFLLANANFFSGVTLYDFLAGVWMDLITIGIYFIPFYALSVLPLPFYFSKWYQLLLKVVFHITNTTVIALNLIDVEYYKYTLKRSTADIYSMVTEGNNMSELLLSFLKDFWWILLIFILLITASNYLYSKTIDYLKKEYKWYLEAPNFILITLLFLIIGRGGFGYRPADMLTAAKITSAKKAALVANTPLSIIKTFGKSSIELKDYFEEGSEYILKPIYTPSPEYKIRENVNVMIVILESFGDEWLGQKTGGPYTPFLDSLLDESLYFENGFANGKKSIEAVPSIFAGIPSLMDNPYISSLYGTNNIEALPQILSRQGYSSGFFHGATNGSMKFDVFAAHLGFENYYGRTEFNDESKADGAWGILDEYFMPWTAEMITTELKEPFLAGLFTLSSHHPYFVPEEYRETLPKGPAPIAQSIAYSDMSLKLFFEEAKQQPWYKNTIFVITADHTPSGYSIRYNQTSGAFQVPIAIFDPMKEVAPKRESEIFNHIDIMPTLLDLTGYNKAVYSFGSSYFDKKNKAFNVNYLDNTFIYFEDDYVINVIDDQTVGFYNYHIDTLLHYDSTKFYRNKSQEMGNKLKGVIQTYNRDLINNTMIVK